MSLLSSFDVISVVAPDPKIFLWIPACAAESAPVNPNVTNTSPVENYF